jgi:predicted lipoprotein with Yx(FWY)xxD motif
MRTIVATTLLLGLGALGFLAAGGLAGAGTNGTISLRTTKLRPVLVNSKGHTLYLFAKDRSGRTMCTGACAGFWPPLVTRGKVSTGTGVKKALVGTTKRSNGMTQVTYNRHPLYTYSLDRRAGQTRGQRVSAFGGRWYAVSAAGKAVVQTSPPTVTTKTTTTEPYPTDPYP